MPAYVLAHTAVSDPEPMRRHAAAVTAVTERFGGRYLFAGPGAQVLEGDWPGTAIAIIEFPSCEDALRWYRSPEYATLIPLRQQAGATGLVLTPEVPA